MGSIKLTARLLTPRPSPALFEATGVRDDWGVHSSGDYTQLSAGTHSTHEQGSVGIGAHDQAVGKTELTPGKKGKARDPLRTPEAM